MFTRLLRPDVTEPDDHLQAPPDQLAFWLLDNWWRLRWEPVPAHGMNPGWRLAHELSGIGGGYPWPRLAIWGEGERVGLSVQSDPPGVVGPVRYITDALLFVSGEQFEAAADTFVQMVSEERMPECHDNAALRALAQSVCAERSDPPVAEWRRIEARLGFDCDEAPEALMQDLSVLVQRYGQSSIEEVAMAAPGPDAAKILHEQIEFSRTSGHRCDLTGAVNAVGVLHSGPSEPPWVSAELAAARVRKAFGVEKGPLRNKRLGELLSVSESTFQSLPGSALGRRYGLRVRDPEDRVALRARWSHDRRFDMARALGDAIWSRTDNLGPLASSKTSRQRFQRAFAQSLLCPYDALVEYLGTDEFREDDIAEDVAGAARHFHVAEKAVRTLLLNKGKITRSQFEDRLEAA